MLRLQLTGGLCGLVISLQASPAAFDCLIEPTQAIDVASPVVGLLERVHVRRCDRVSKGQGDHRVARRAGALQGGEANWQIAAIEHQQAGVKCKTEFPIAIAVEKAVQ